MTLLLILGGSGAGAAVTLVDPENLSIDYDSAAYANAVYIKAKTPEASGWYYDHAEIARVGFIKSTSVDAPDCDTAAMAQSMATMYLGRVAGGIVRGRFSISSPYNGWRAGQNVSITSTELGLVAQSFQIVRVRTSILGPASQRRYDIEFGSARAGRAVSGEVTGSIMGSSIRGDILDDSGGSLISGGLDATSALSPAIRRALMAGVYNGDFILTPNSPDSLISTVNALPYWTFTKVGGTAIDATSVADSAAASGRAIQFTMGPGIAGDDTYIEQIVPINGGRSKNWVYSAHATFLTGSTVSTAVAYCTAQYLKSDGTTTTGAAATVTSTTTAIGASTVKDLDAARANANGTIPSDAYFLRVRVGYKRDVAAVGLSETVTLCEIRVLGYSTTLAVAERDAPATYGPGWLYQINGTLFLQANLAGAGGYQPVAELLASTGNIDLKPANGGYVNVGSVGAGANGYIIMSERTDPAAPGVNQAALYTRDNGAGKTQIVARFNTGAVVVIATEP
jgi:hypothetical protein